MWDVFLLLGDPDHFPSKSALSNGSSHPPANLPLTNAPSNPSKPSDPPESPGKVTPIEPFNGSLDVLHATSAALIDGMREILLDADFENAMKTLTSWVPIRDEDVLMRVAAVEWGLHRRKG